MNWFKTFILVMLLALAGTAAQFAMVEDKAHGEGWDGKAFLVAELKPQEYANNGMALAQRHKNGLFVIGTEAPFAALCIANPVHHDQSVAKQSLPDLMKAVRTMDIPLFRKVFTAPGRWCRAKIYDPTMRIRNWTVAAKVGDPFEVEKPSLVQDKSKLCRQFYSIWHDHKEPDDSVTKIWALSWTNFECSVEA